jgi:hypothetical protein
MNMEIRIAYHTFVTTFYLNLRAPIAFLKLVIVPGFESVPLFQDFSLLIFT